MDFQVPFLLASLLKEGGYVEKAWMDECDKFKK
jgi:hypothetical protein